MKQKRIWGDLKFVVAVIFTFCGFVLIGVGIRDALYPAAANAQDYLVGFIAETVAGILLVCLLGNYCLRRIKEYRIEAQNEAMVKALRDSPFLR